MAKKENNQKNNQNKFQEKITRIFLNAGFKPLKTEKKPFSLQAHDIELDHIFVCNNVLIVCEDTIFSYTLRQEKDKNKKAVILDQMKKHKDNKKKAANIILNNKKEFIEVLKNKFNNFDPNGRFCSVDYIIHFLYFDYMSDEASHSEILKYAPLKFVSQATVDYFYTISSSIKKSFQYELYRFLGVKREDYLPSEIEGSNKYLNSPIIYPERWTGYEGGIRVVTFMIQPKVLLEIACVLRKDSWDGKNDLYQRLITQKRIKEVRSFLVNERTMFLNNIIVTMPENTTFCDSNGNSVSIENINNSKEHYKVSIPLEYNSMAIIDGQHRVYAFYEDAIEDDEERKIAVQRDRHCLLVTGIIYPKNEEWTDEKRRQFESRLFLSINRNSKQVDADTLIIVQSILDPTSREGLSRKVIEDMNKRDPFENMFKMTKMSTAPISISSIVQYALVSLVDTNAKKDRRKSPNKTLYYYWLIKERKAEDYQFSLHDRDQYVKYCSQCLCKYFKAVHSHFFEEWSDPESKILKVIGINSFIIAYRETLPLTNGPQNTKYYESIMKGWKFHFKNTDEATFNYSGSNYKKLANEIIIPMFEKNISKGV